MKQTLYMVVWQAIRLKESEWAKIYERLVPIKCGFDERTRQYVGKGKIIGRLAGQIVSVMYTLLKKDQETVSKLPPGAKAPDPVLYDPELHRQHRSGQYRHPSPRGTPHKLIQLPRH